MVIIKDKLKIKIIENNKEVRYEFLSGLDLNISSLRFFRY
jgi:hypothetical protein